MPDKLNDVVVPDGMRFVGYYCEHQEVLTDDGQHTYRYTPHRAPFYNARPKYKAERGWDETLSTTKSLDFPDYREGDAERKCQYRIPMFVRETDLEKP